MDYKISELAQRAGVTKRTIHYYISKGLLMPPVGVGVNSIYNDLHLERLNQIKKLQEKYIPLNKIRELIYSNSIAEECETPLEEKEETILIKSKDVFIRENICNIFELNYSQENGEKYKHIIENIKSYVEKMLED